MITPAMALNRDFRVAHHPVAIHQTPGREQHQFYREQSSRTSFLAKTPAGKAARITLRHGDLSPAFLLNAALLSSQCAFPYPPLLMHIHAMLNVLNDTSS